MKILILLLAFTYCASPKSVEQSNASSTDSSSLIDTLKQQAESEQGKKLIQTIKEKAQDKETQEKIKSLFMKDKKK